MSDRFTTFEKIATGLVLLTGLLLTGLTFKMIRDSHKNRTEITFEQQASDTANALVNTLIRHTNLLVSLQGLFHSTEKISRVQFNRFIRSIDRERLFPEAAAFSWNALVDFDEVSAFESSVRTDASLVPGGYPEFSIRPALSEPDSTGMVVTYMEPFEGNENAFGFNIASNPARHSAAELARDTNSVVITEPIVLTQDSGDQKAFLMLLPTYSTMSPDSENARKLAHTGQVVVVTRAGELIESSDKPEFAFFQVLDNTDEQIPVNDRLLYSEGTPLAGGSTDAFLQSERDISIGSRSWQLTFQQNLERKPLADSAVEYVVLALGTLASLLAAMLFSSLASSRRKAQLHADKLTKDLQLANEELQRSNNDLSQFAHVASHDLQTPVRNVISAVTLLEERLGENTDPAVQEYLGFLNKASLRMRTLVTDLLGYARLGRDAIEFAPVDLNAVLAEVQDATRSQIDESSATLHIDPLPQITGDARQLHRVFENLVSNAIKYSHPDRTPKITIRYRENPDPEHVQIRVSDNGQGIEDKFKDTVFVPFKRLHRHDEIPGTGLGLGICKQIIERHGGRIHVEQSSDQGSTFMISLPAHGSSALHEPQP